MRKAVVPVVLLPIFLLGCSEESTAPEASVQVHTQLAASVVTARNTSAATPLGGGATVDSLQLTRVRILLSRLKLHPTQDTGVGGRDVKVGPFVAVFTAQPQLLGSTSLPGGTYRWVKLEFHRFSDSEAARYAADTLFRDFALPDRASLILEGTLFVADSAIPFVYRSTVTANAALSLDPPASVAEGEVLRILLQFEPRQVFRRGNLVVDPRDPRWRSDIENALRDALKALKQP
jgi:hypothetical protein